MTTLQQIIEKYNMVNLAYDEMSDFERDILKYAEQEPKTGYWIKIVVNGQHKIKCDKCDYIEPEYATHIRNYCPNCGVKMVEPQESEG